MRYRLSTLLVAMVWVGLVCLALRAPNYWWSGGMFALLVLVLLTAVLVAIYRAGRLRAMAIGFLIFSGGYLVVQRNYFPAKAPSLTLPDGMLIEWTFNVLHGGLEADANIQRALERLNRFQGIWRCSLATAIGLLGASIAQALYATRPGERPPAAGVTN